MIATKSLLISSILGSLAGACECEKDGNVVIQPDQIIKKINSIEDSSRYKIQSKKWELLSLEWVSKEKKEKSSLG